MTNIENEVDRMVDEFINQFLPTDRDEKELEYTKDELRQETWSIRAYGVRNKLKTLLASLTEQHQNEKTFMLTEFEKVKKLREDEHQMELQIADDRWKANEQYRDKYMDAYTQGVLEGKKECQREKEAIVREILERMGKTTWGNYDPTKVVIEIATNHNIL